MKDLMHRISWLGLSLVAATSACVAPEAGEAGEAGDPAAPQLSETEQAAFSYSPMGFARVSAAGTVGASFNSAGGAITVSHSLGLYTVTFAGLGASLSGDALGGNIQITAEGTSDVRCQSGGWGAGPTNVSATVRCSAPDGTAADTPFSILFHRYAMPAPNAWPTTAAYSWVTGTGGVSTLYDYNSSGAHNTVARLYIGQYNLTVTNATSANASVMITPYGGPAGAVCSLFAWTGNVARIHCADRLGAPLDVAFNFSYAVSGPARDQQGGHARFTGSSALSTYAAALGKVSWCSPASITGFRSLSLATMTLTGELGSWTADPFRRASFASRFGDPGYCKIETLVNAEGSPTSTSTSTVRCYSATGAVIAVPHFTFTQVTSDATGPC